MVVQVFFSTFAYSKQIHQKLKRLLTLLVCVLATCWGDLQAQCLKIDSLRQQLSLPTLADTTRINILNVLGHEYVLNKQYYYALSMAQQAYQAAERKGYKVGMGDALLTVGDINFHSDDIAKRDNEAVPNYTKALDLFLEAKAHDRIAIAYKTLGDYYYNVSYQKNEYEQQALDYYLLYLKASEKSGDKPSLAQAYENVGYLYETLGDDKKSTEYFLKVINLKQEIEQKDVNNPHIFSKTQKYYNLQIENQRLFTSIFLGGVALLAIIVFILYILLNYRRRAHRLLQRQKEEIEEQKEKIEIKNAELEQQKEEISTQRDQLAKQTEQLASAQVKVERANDLLKDMVQNLEKAVAQRTEQLQKTNQMLFDANKELDILIYRASHDFKGPVATLTGLSYIGKMECGDFAPAVEILGKIEEVAVKMDKMLEKLHQVSYIIGKELELELVDVGEVVENATYSLHKILDEHPIQIETTISPSFKFEADAEILQMMLENIIENASLYRREDALPAPALHIIAESDEQTATLTFEDNGQGIPSDFVHKAFDMFSRGTELAKGNGLGLYVVKQGLERFYGQETVQSVEGMFTRITLTFDKKAMNFNYRATLLESLDWETDENSL